LGNYRHKVALTNRVYVCPDCGNTADRDLKAAKNIERWFEGRSILGRSDKMASYAKIGSEVDKHLERQLKTALKQEVSGKSIELSLFDLLT
jgi:putative transposase